ncbi:hypothetical protein B9Z55_005480 [Caenorhabditis nigoni]|uniref:F-box domain-containing protein n=1 Tax=Caenorhabditis nigoni TaxID=1611254 RepID=A0A2G5V110_9PELO|nr:hypothetical protein B9Z55_005480 [Caenorhabditis nigoni]
MKLLKYPYVVQTEILDHMNNSDLFELSLVSKKIRKLVKSSQMKRLKNTVSIMYDCCWLSGRPLVYIQYKENSIMFYSKIFFFIPSENRTIIEYIHNNFLYFFGNSVEYYWKTDNYKILIPRLENLSVCCRIRIPNKFEDLENVDNFFTSHPVLKSIDLGFWADESLSPESESRLYQVESIKISQYDLKLPPVLRNFQGKQAILDCCLCQASDLIEFVKRWKAGEAYQNLEHLKIRRRREEIPLDETLTAIGAQHIYATRKRPAHTLPKLFIEYAFEPTTDPITSHSYVVRESDNRVASVLIQEKTLSFGVWDKTEEEFLRMVD